MPTQLGELLERSDPAEAIELYCAFPPPPPNMPPTFNHAVLANSSVRLLIELKDFANPQLVHQLIVVGKVLGVLNIEKFVQVGGPSLLALIWPNLFLRDLT